MRAIKARPQTGGKVSVTSICFSQKGEIIMGGCQDGSLQLWDFRENNLYRPSVFIPFAHAPNSEVTCILGFRDSRRFVSRALDDSMKVWDMRKSDQPLFSWDEQHSLFNLNPKTSVTLSPNEKIVLTGTSVRKGYAHGEVVGFSTVTGEKVCSIPSTESSVV